jgi:beta-glucosidase
MIRSSTYVRIIFCLIALVATSLTLSTPTSAATLLRTASTRHGALGSARCPWVSESLHHRKSPSALASQVLSRMTLAEKVSFVVLVTHPPLENNNEGVPRLCIPALTLVDGPNGVANGFLGVTKFPAALGVAASFNPSLARSLGRAMALQARAKGMDVLQSPDLNLARIPESGRLFETYGEDPFLTGTMGVNDIEGIQSAGIMAEAKHFTAYTQETARVKVDQFISKRALAELYNAPFRQAVEVAHVAAVMCSYGSLNGVNTCSDPYIYRTLRSWGFKGFVRSDLDAVTSPSQAFLAGISLIKPGSTRGLEHLVRVGVLRVATLNGAIYPVLSEMFRFGLVARPLQVTPYVSTNSSAVNTLALHAAEQSIVLLKNSRSILPISKRVRRVAVIGVDASSAPVIGGGGSSSVTAPFVITPLSALRLALGSHTKVVYSSGGPTISDLDSLRDVDILRGTPLQVVRRIKHSGEKGKEDVVLERSPNVSRSIITATAPGHGPGWQVWHLTLRAKRSGTFQVSFQQIGDSWLYLNNASFLISRGLHARATLSRTVQLVAGTQYTFSAKWFQVRNHIAPSFSIVNVTSAIANAVKAARQARVAIVFVGQYSAEGVDRTNLSLPGDANALIEAVAHANPRTIVVLNTGGAVTMPWLSHVRAVLEAWYPGQMDGTAIARVLSGTVDPSGRLPISFPTSSSAQPATHASQFPGVNAVVHYGAGDSGLDIGYRWFQAHHVATLFPFGFGLDFVRFKYSSPQVVRTNAGFKVSVNVKNLGHRSGTSVVEAYVHDPSSTGEPPNQLRGFVRVTLRPRSSQRVSVLIPWSAFQIWRGTGFHTVAGTYAINVGQSSASLPIRVPVTLH